MSETKYQRNKDDGAHLGKESSGVVNNEVSRLLKEHKDAIPQNILMELRKKYNDEQLVDRILYAYTEKMHDIRKKAQKFAELVMKKYGKFDYPLHTLLKKAYKYKAKNNLSDSEYDEFRRIYEKSIANQGMKSQSTTIYAPVTQLSKLLGPVSFESTEGIKFDPKEQGDLQEIIKLYTMSRSIHAQIVLQSMMYTDVAYQALTGEYDRNKQNPNDFVHPVVAALFLPKIPFLEEHMLIANIPYIVKCRYAKEPIMTKPDYELLYDLISDPNDIVCNFESPVKDVKHRAMIQHHLWNNVLRLRNGQYYGTTNTDLLMAIDACKISSYDSPDLMYHNDEGTIMRRLLAAFSIRPTIVTTSPLYTVANSTFGRQLILPPKVTSIPMINLRLPSSVLPGQKNLNLNDAIDQPQWFLDDGVIVPKTQSIIYSKGILVFYVNRRYNTINIGKMTQAFDFNRLPVTITGFESLNDKPVQFDFDMTINDESFHLRSVVCVEVSKPNLITGTSAIIRKLPREEEGIVTDNFYWYAPGRAGIASYDTTDATQSPPSFSKPVSSIPGIPSFDNIESFTEMASTRGTIFIYSADNIVSNKALQVYYS